MDEALKNSEEIFKKKESKMEELATIKTDINGDFFLMVILMQSNVAITGLEVALFQ